MSLLKESRQKQLKRGDGLPKEIIYSLFSEFSQSDHHLKGMLEMLRDEIEEQGFDPDELIPTVIDSLEREEE